MTNQMRLFAKIAVILFMIVLVSGCTKNQPSKLTSTEKPMNTAETTPNVEEFTEYTFEEIDKQDSPTYESSAAFLTPSGISDMFAMSKIVVRGKVVGVKEYKISAESNYHGESDTFYKSVVSLKISKNYSDAKLEFVDDNVITFVYPQTSVDHFTELDSINEGDVLIAVLAETVKASSIDRLYELAPYVTVMPDSTIYLKVDGGYDAAPLMTCAGYDEKKSYKRKEVEKVILENIDLLENLSLREYIEKYK